MKIRTKKAQKGQSIIETVVAIFVLVMGITAALGLANYSFSASTNVTKQIVGTGLAREGLEAVKNMRDTNWLKGTKSTDCFNYVDNTNTADCFKDWQTAMYDLRTSGGTISFVLTPLASSNRYGAAYVSNSSLPMWGMISSLNAAFLGYDGYRLAQDANLLTNTPNGSFYYPRLASDSLPSSGYYREIVIQEDSTKAPYAGHTTDIGPRLIVTSRVWWNDKKCPDSTSYANAQTACRISLQMYLTNWRTY